MPVNIRRLISHSPTAWVRAWLRVLGPPFIALTVVISLLGGVIAFHHTGLFNFGFWILSTVGLICIHFATSCLNDYFDFLSGTDNINLSSTIFSGGSGVIQEGKLSAKALLITGTLFITFGSVIGIYLTFLNGLPILLLGLVGVFFAVGYVHPKINLSKKGFGELAVGLSFGPIMLSGVYYVQTKIINLNVIFIGIMMGLLATTVLWINQIPDYQADKTTGKTNWVVRLGKKKASYIFVALLSFVYILTAIFIIMDILPRPSWILFLSLVLAIKTAWIALRDYNDVKRLLPANALTIALTITYGILLSSVFLIEAQKSPVF